MQRWKNNTLGGKSFKGAKNHSNDALNKRGEKESGVLHCRSASSALIGCSVAKIMVANRPLAADALHDAARDPDAGRAGLCQPARDARSVAAAIEPFDLRLQPIVQ